MWADLDVAFLFTSSPSSSRQTFLSTAVTTQYGAIFNTAAHIADVNPGVTLLEIPLIFPTTHAEIVQLVKDTVAKVKKDEEKTGKKIKLSVVEAISSIPGGKSFPQLSLVFDSSC